VEDDPLVPRGFKYALVSGLAAYAANAKEVIVSEKRSRKPFGPAPRYGWSSVFPDYRSHPLFYEPNGTPLQTALFENVRYAFAFPQLLAD